MRCYACHKSFCWLCMNKSRQHNRCACLYHNKLKIALSVLLSPLILAALPILLILVVVRLVQVALKHRMHRPPPRRPGTEPLRQMAELQMVRFDVADTDDERPPVEATDLVAWRYIEATARDDDHPAGLHEPEAGLARPSALVHAEAIEIGDEVTAALRRVVVSVVQHTDIA
jgi:hypothetical protein